MICVVINILLLIKRNFISFSVDYTLKTRWIFFQHLFTHKKGAILNRIFEQKRGIFLKKILTDKINKINLVLSKIATVNQLTCSQFLVFG